MSKSDLSNKEILMEIHKEVVGLMSKSDLSIKAETQDEKSSSSNETLMGITFRLVAYFTIGVTFWLVICIISFGQDSNSSSDSNNTNIDSMAQSTQLSTDSTINTKPVKIKTKISTNYLKDNECKKMEPLLKEGVRVLSKNLQGAIIDSAMTSLDSCSNSDPKLVFDYTLSSGDLEHFYVSSSLAKKLIKAGTLSKENVASEIDNLNYEWKRRKESRTIEERESLVNKKLLSQFRNFLISDISSTIYQDNNSNNITGLSVTVSVTDDWYIIPEPKLEAIAENVCNNIRAEIRGYDDIFNKETFAEGNAFVSCEYHDNLGAVVAEKKIFGGWNIKS